MKNLKSILIGVGSGILVIVIYLTTMNIYNKSYYKKHIGEQGVVNMIFYKVEDKISIKHYPINIDSLRHFFLDSAVSFKKKMDSLGKLTVTLNDYLEK